MLRRLVLGEPETRVPVQISSQRQERPSRWGQHLLPPSVRISRKLDLGAEPSFIPSTLIAVRINSSRIWAAVPNAYPLMCRLYNTTKSVLRWKFVDRKKLGNVGWQWDILRSDHISHNFFTIYFILPSTHVCHYMQNKTIKCFFKNTIICLI